MKPIFIALSMLLSLIGFSQQTTPGVNTDYLQKSKNQKKAAKILLWGGVLVTGVAVAAAAGSVCVGCPEKPKDQSGWVILGGTMMISSIPLFIASSKNKKKATAISFKMETVPAVQQQSFMYHSYPALSLNFTIH